MDRREFITWLAGGSFALAVAPARAATAGAPPLSPWIQIAPDGRITLTTTALEMGQGARTGQAQILADELDAPWDRIEVVTAPLTDPFLHEGELYSGGSQTLRNSYDILRRAGATARGQLIRAAANRWGVEASACRTEPGEVVHVATRRRLRYGALAGEAAICAPLQDPPLKTAAERRYVGKSLSTLAQPTKVNGEARYGIDFRLPGMAFATIRQAPVDGGTLVSVDEAPALAVRGVRKVVMLKDAVAVVADTTYAAFKGAKALDPRWTGAGLSSPAIRDALTAHMDAADAVVSPRQGGAAARERLRAAYAASSRKIEAVYELAYLAHATMEPMNATARADATSAEVWAPCQGPTWMRRDVAEATGIPKDKVTVHPLLMGGGFGRRGRNDYGVRAVQVAQALDGPVQVVWTREEDMTHDYYRPAMRMMLRAPLAADGTLSGYEVLAATADDLTGGSNPPPYDLPDFAATLAKVPAGVRIGAWRAVDPGMAMFARESFIDECAHEAGADPLAYRAAMLGKNPRALRCLQAAAKAIGWESPRGPGVGRGLAMLQDWDTVVAHAVEVKVDGSRLRVQRIVAVGDVGVVVNPQQVRAQFEGGGLMGLSAALGEEVTFTDGRAEQTNFTRYPVLHMAQAPPIEVILLETPDVPIGGAGEPPLPGIAPALANAVFQACGRRVRSLPFRTQGFEV